MNKLSRRLGLGMILLSFADSSFANPVDPAKFIRDQGWTQSDMRPTATSPSRNVVPIMFRENGSNFPSCGILLAAPDDSPPRLVELARTEPGVAYPQCMAIDSMTSFKLGGRAYISVEYVQRETREDFYRYNTLIYGENGGAYHVDESLASSLEDSPKLANAMVGIKLARIKYMKKMFSQWRLLDRDFISEKTSSFATFDDVQAHRCHFVVEAGEMPIATHHDDFVSGAECGGVSASGRLEKAGTIYYLAMFNAEKKAAQVAVVSVAPSGKITVEKELSNRINRTGSIMDIKSAKLALSEALQ